jgi:hypothetical protein
MYAATFGVVELNLARAYSTFIGTDKLYMTSDMLEDEYTVRVP